VIAEILIEYQKNRAAGFTLPLKLNITT